MNRHDIELFINQWHGYFFECVLTTTKSEEILAVHLMLYFFPILFPREMSAQLSVLQRAIGIHKHIALICE